MDSKNGHKAAPCNSIQPSSPETTDTITEATASVKITNTNTEHNPKTKTDTEETNVSHLKDQARRNSGPNMGSLLSVDHTYEGLEALKPGDRIIGASHMSPIVFSYRK